MKRMKLNLDSIALLLFCIELKNFKEIVITHEEWLYIEKTLRAHGLRGPASLLKMSYDEFMDFLHIEEFVAYKLSKRISALDSFLSCLYELEAKGISITTKYEPDFPKSLASLKKRAPFFVYYYGNIEGVKEGITISGLVHCLKKDHSYIKRLVDKIKDEDKMLVCNDTKGTDEIALKYAIHHDCFTALLVCHNMQDTYQKYRRYVNQNKLVIMSFFDPSSKFDITKAIDRNSYVCGMSKYQIVLSTNINNGATWFTVMQNLHNKWNTVFVVDNETVANTRLLDMKTVPLKVKDILSDNSFEILYERNHKEEVEEISMDQMSIFEFIGEHDEQEF